MHLGMVRPMSEGQAWILIVEVGILALASLLGMYRRP